MREPWRARIREVMATEGALFANRLRSPEAMEAFRPSFRSASPISVRSERGRPGPARRQGQPGAARLISLIGSSADAQRAQAFGTGRGWPLLSIAT